MALAEDEHWMQQALALADRAAEAGEVPVGALVVYEGRLAGSGYNRPVSSADPTAHAEIGAIRAASRALGNYRLSGATLYVTLEPCAMCAGALVHARISRLVFGAREPKAGAVVSRQRLLEHPAMNWQVAVTEGVMADESAQRLQRFFARRRAEKRGQAAEQPTGNDS